MAVEASPSTFNDLLLEMQSEMVELLNPKTNWLLNMLVEEEAERKRLDDEYLASLAPFVRRRVVARRRLKGAALRCRQRWDANVAWRLRADPPDNDCW